MTKMWHGTLFAARLNLAAAVMFALGLLSMSVAESSVNPREPAPWARPAGTAGFWLFLSLSAISYGIAKARARKPPASGAMRLFAPLSFLALAAVGSWSLASGGILWQACFWLAVVCIYAACLRKLAELVARKVRTPGRAADETGLNG